MPSHGFMMMFKHCITFVSCRFFFSFDEQKSFIHDFQCDAFVVMCLVIKFNDQIYFRSSFHRGCTCTHTHTLSCRWLMAFAKNWLKNGSKSWWWIFIEIPIFFFGRIITICYALEFQFWWEFSANNQKNDRENGRSLNNKYQHEITNHLNTAAYDTNGVINSTKRDNT